MARVVKARLAAHRRFAHKQTMTRNDPGLQELIGDARWLAHRYDEATDSIQFRFVPREAQRSMTFLTEFEIGDAPLAVYSREESLAEARERDIATPRMIFHSAYCCSTLLARAFDAPGASFGLKEPQLLNDVIGLHGRGGDPRLVAAVLDAALLLLARPYAEGEVNVIKPSNLVNPLIPLISAMRSDLRALMLHAPLEIFLGSVARKEIEGRAWVRELMWKLINLGQADRFGFTTEDLYRQTDLQAASVGWLIQQAIFAEAASAHPGFRTIDSETLMAQPVKSIAALADLYEICLDPAEVAAGPAFRTHSKDRSDYSSTQRKQDREHGNSVYAREIGIVMEWTTKLAEHVGVPLTLPSPLHDD